MGKKLSSHFTFGLDVVSWLSGVSPLPVDGIPRFRPPHRAYAARAIPRRLQRCRNDAGSVPRHDFRSHWPLTGHHLRQLGMSLHNGPQAFVVTGQARALYGLVTSWRKVHAPERFGSEQDILLAAQGGLLCPLPGCQCPVPQRLPCWRNVEAYCRGSCRGGTVEGGGAQDNEDGTCSCEILA
jgi:hypothetical protein